ncbi:hypothetical protein FMM01_13550 [Schleiferilactobacillus harbinensis]|uniref:hypothetical protein n=1 Tax=Schleiferilactobacillus harbinensis TaxID=304207 RepID=UPI00123AEBCB|nr:hypothetical protein [Schleiferilactobacillus harbinensis]QEU48250.1 hypothetical protein FMM01_13550 [Schleiferilactobacillus harbinensis]
MTKAIMRPKEYTVIKVPTDCKHIGEYLAKATKHVEKFLEIKTNYSPVSDTASTTTIDGHTILGGSVIVIDPTALDREAVHVMDQDEYTKVFEEKPDVVSIDDAVIKGGKIDSEFRFQLSEHTYATIGPDGLAITDTGDGTVNMSELDRVLKDLATALNQERRVKLD